DARLRDSRAPARLEHVDGPTLEAARHPLPYGTAAQPLVLEGAELVEIVVRMDVLTGIPALLTGPVQPEWTAGRRIEVPGDHSAHPGVERLARRIDCRRQRDRGHRIRLRETWPAC